MGPFRSFSTCRSDDAKADAVGPTGLYFRTHSFERRDSWNGVFLIRASKKRVAILSASMVHVIPMKAFASEDARNTFVNTIEREVAARPRSVYV